MSYTRSCTKCLSHSKNTKHSDSHFNSKRLALRTKTKSFGTHDHEHMWFFSKLLQHIWKHTRKRYKIMVCSIFYPVILSLNDKFSNSLTLNTHLVGSVVCWRTTRKFLNSQVHLDKVTAMWKVHCLSRPMWNLIHSFAFLPGDFYLHLSQPLPKKREKFTFQVSPFSGIRNQRMLQKCNEV